MTRTSALLLAVWLLAGCRGEEVEVHRVLKAAVSEAVPAPVPPAADERALRWDAPKGWRALPGGGMRYATFVIPGPGGSSVELSVVALQGRAGGELANINRWRGQVGLPPLDEGSLEKRSERVNSAAGTLRAVDYGGREPAGTRILGAILRWREKTWFFKILGPDPAVAAAKPAFLAFLKSLR